MKLFSRIDGLLAERNSQLANLFFTLPSWPAFLSFKRVPRSKQATSPHSYFPPPPAQRGKKRERPRGRKGSRRQSRSYSLQSASGSASRSCSGTIHDLCMNTRKSGRQWGQCHLLRSRNDSRGGVRIHRFFQLVVARRSDRAQRRRSDGDLATGERRNGRRKKVRVGPCKRERMR